MVLVTTSFLKLAIWSLRRTFGVWRKRQPHTLFVVRLLHATGWECGERDSHTRSSLFDCYMRQVGTVEKETTTHALRCSIVTCQCLGANGRYRNRQPHFFHSLFAVENLCPCQKNVKEKIDKNLFQNLIRSDFLF